MDETSAIEARRAFQRGLRSLFGADPAPARLACSRCSKPVPSDSRWVCGHCEFENRRTRLYSFLNKCQECGREPASFSCPHCGEANPLSEEASGGPPAKCLLGEPERPRKPEPPPPPAPDPRHLRRHEHEDRREALVQEIEIARLNARLAQIKAKGTPEEQSLHAELEESYSRYEANFMGVHMVAKEKRAKNAELYKDDPEMLSRAEDLVTAWVEEKLR